ncbi:MAG: hypothetical protein K0Q79_769 [Flavipsychrobacter sp.]|jgi:hypothetical protein|nr:hypothetical protein [Flavipsychrobacter sp.]
MINKSIRLAALGLISICATTSYAQFTRPVRHNLYPYADAVVYDNNGRDLAGFIKSNKRETGRNAEKISEFSNNKWGYIQISNARVPSINIRPTAEGKKVDLSYSEYIDATLALFNTKEGVQATWWARQANKPDGAFFSKKVDKTGLDAQLVRYEELVSEMNTKDFTIVDYNDSVYNDKDYDKLLKNYIIVDNSAVKDVNDYKQLIEFFNNFLSKFTYVEDPLLENKSFITCVTVNKTKYLGYFNVIQNKLAGHLQVADLQYQRDIDSVVTNVFKKLKGKTVYVYGDDIFGMEKTLLKYAHLHPALTLIRRNTSTTDKFNSKEK